MLKLLLSLIILLTLSQAKNLHKERDYQEYFCKEFGGITEYRLKDKTRVDCLLDEYAIEVDFAKKWAESIGQSLFYANATSRKPAVLLIMENQQRDEKYLRRLESVSAKHHIDIWVINKDFEIYQK